MKMVIAFKESIAAPSARHSTTFDRIESKTFVLCTPSWRGAMIEADQNTEPPPSAGDKEAPAPGPVYPAKPAPPEGQCRDSLFLKCLLLFARV